MSDILRLNGNSKRLKVKLQNPLAETEQSEKRKEEDYIQTNLQNYYDRGYSEGRASAAEEIKKQFEEQLNNHVEKFTKVLSEINAKISEYDKAFEKIVIELAFLIAEKIIRSEIKDRNTIGKTLKDSVKKVIGSNNVIVKLNPDDLKIVNESINEILQGSNFSQIKFEPDETIEQGGCYVETEIGNVDARISTQLDELKKRLEGI